jgi:hypothetical protein
MSEICFEGRDARLEFGEALLAIDDVVGDDVVGILSQFQRPEAPLS